VKQARAASPAEHGGLSGRDVHLPVLGRNYKKKSYCLDCLLLMQVPRRNVDFSNPGLIGRRREEKLLSARVAAGIGVSIWVAWLHFQHWDLFSPQSKGSGHTYPVSDGAKLHPSLVAINQHNCGHTSSI
jgi:hypothetical protein